MLLENDEWVGEFVGVCVHACVREREGGGGGI